MDSIVSSHGLPQTYLRISITDRCNLRCGYCMPPAGRTLVDHADLLTYEELLRLSRLLAARGVKKIRVTGGEPLVRRHVVRFLEELSAVDGVGELCLTTNGTRLGPMAAAIRAAGVRRINVSLDSLRPDRYAALTGGGALQEVLAGLDAAAAAGFDRVKLNTVLIRGVNDDEVADFGRFAAARGFTQRFIELMPFRMPAQRGVTEAEVRIALATAALDASGVEFISQLTRPFCGGCARLRIDSRGRMKGCLLSRQHLDLRAMLRRGEDDGAIAGGILAFVRHAEKKLAEELPRFEERAGCLEMSEIGG